MKKLVLSFVFFLMVGFFLAPKAHAQFYQNAANGYFSSSSTNTTDYFPAIPTTSFTLSYSNTSVSFFATSTAATLFGNMTQVTTVSVLINDPNPPHNIILTNFTCVDGTGSHADSSNGFTTSDNSTHNVTFTLTNPVACDVNNAFVYLRATFLVGTGVGGDNVRFLATNNNSIQGIGYAEGTSTTLKYTNYVMAIAINGSFASTPSGNSSAILNCGVTDFSIFGIDYGQGLCNVFKFVFVPDQGVLDGYSLLWDDIKYKPPFGYFGSITSTTTLGGLATTTPTSTPPFVNRFGGFVFLSGFITPVDTGLAFLVVVSFGLWIFYRFKHFNI